MKCFAMVLGMLIAVFGLVRSAEAAQVWIPSLSVPATAANSSQFLTIDNYRLYWNGINAVLTVTFKEPINTGCTASDNGKLVSYWSNPLNGYHQSWLSIIIAAKAMGQKVRMLYENTICDSVGGRMMHGLEPLIVE